MSDTMNPDVFLDQSALALQLTLVSGDLDASQFSILGRDCRDFGGGVRVKALIIGASHAINYRCGDWRVWEVFACTNVEGASVDFCEGLAHLQEPLQFTFGKHFYQFEAQICLWQEGCARAESLQNFALSPVENEIRLSTRFPRGDLSQTPQTTIHIQQRGDTIQVETVHSYPNEAQIVFTRSAFSPRGNL